MVRPSEGAGGVALNGRSKTFGPGIKHLKHELLVGVNVVESGDVLHDNISAYRPQVLYIVAFVPVMATIETQAKSTDVHLSFSLVRRLQAQEAGQADSSQGSQAQGSQAYEGSQARDCSVCLQEGQATRPSPCAACLTTRTTLVLTSDTDFVDSLISSGIPLHELDTAFAVTSPGRLNTLLEECTGRTLRSRVSSRIAARRSLQTASISASSPFSSVLVSLRKSALELPARLLPVSLFPLVEWLNAV